MINTKIRGKLQSKYNLPKLLYIKEDESSPSMNNTKLIFFYDELEANVTLLTQTVGPDCLENLYLINTNIETIRQGKLQLIGNRTDELGGHLLNINLNDKFISIYMEHNFPTPTSLSIKVYDRICVFPAVLSKDIYISANRSRRINPRIHSLTNFSCSPTFVLCPMSRSVKSARFLQVFFAEQSLADKMKFSIIPSVELALQCCQ